MPHYYLEGQEPGPAYLYEADPGAPFVLYDESTPAEEVESTPAEEVEEQAPEPENEV